MGTFQTHGTRTSPLTIPTSQHPNPSAALCLVSSPLPAEVSAARFYIVSHDQGWCENQQDGLWSWFEVSIFRPFQPVLNPEFPDANEIKSSPEDFGDMIQELGFHFADIPFDQNDPENIDPSPATSLFLASNASNLDWEHHMITWTLGNKDGEGCQFLSLLEEGDRLVIWARAQV